MKKTLIVITIVLGCLAVGHSERKAIDPNLVWIDVNGVIDCTDNAIQDLVKRGRVCDVIGHRWKDETSLWRLDNYSYSVTPTSHDAATILNYGSIVDGYYVYDGSTSETRTCDLCGVTQVKVVRWEAKK